MTISEIETYHKSTFYKIDQTDESLAFIASHPNSINLLNNPEITGFEIYNSLREPTKNIFDYIINRYGVKLDELNILNIMRGGLNFPIEESCYNLNVNNSVISFITTKRTFNKAKRSIVDVISSKIALIDKATLILGDIIATGETLLTTINLIKDEYKNNKYSIKRIIILTIGTKHSFDIINTLNEEIKKCWGDFEGIIPIFYEGIFSMYNNCGITKLNSQKIDFLLTGTDTFLSPKYRSKILKSNFILFERCPIYDGGERRFESDVHRGNIIKYWDRLKLMSNNIEIKKFIFEKIGYNSDCSFIDWQAKNNYTTISNIDSLYNDEIEFLKILEMSDFEQICSERYENLCEHFKQ